MRLSTHHSQFVRAGASLRANANLLFHLSAERKHSFQEMLNISGSPLLQTALLGGETLALVLSPATALCRYLAQSL